MEKLAAEDMPRRRAVTFGANMQPDEWCAMLRSFLDRDNGSSLETIHAGSRICHIPNVAQRRLAIKNKPRDDFKVCLVELGYLQIAPPGALKN